LLFENTPNRIKLLAQFLPKLVIINSVNDTLAEINSSFVRINGWSTFLSPNIIEASSLQKQNELEAEEVFTVFEKNIEWLPDIPGFITPRVISMIINEAYFALAEGVSTPDEIDTAMKLGTAYPYGPLDWGAKIGLQNIVTLLEKLSITHPRYMPCELLVQETNRSI
jgi:3-hydroxybutyryl-CoA dehydrogenase